MAPVIAQAGWPYPAASSPAGSERVTLKPGDLVVEKDDLIGLTPQEEALNFTVLSHIRANPVLCRKDIAIKETSSQHMRAESDIVLEPGRLSYFLKWNHVSGNLAASKDESWNYNARTGDLVVRRNEPQPEELSYEASIDHTTLKIDGKEVPLDKDSLVNQVVADYLAQAKSIYKTTSEDCAFVAKDKMPAQGDRQVAAYAKRLGQEGRSHAKLQPKLSM